MYHFLNTNDIILHTLLYMLVLHKQYALEIIHYLFIEFYLIPFTGQMTFYCTYTL